MFFFASGGYRQHPDKTFIGRTGKGFDWMGIQFNGQGMTGVAPRALANHRERCRRLYEQVWRYGKKKTMARVSAYVKRWTIWRNSMTEPMNRYSGPASCWRQMKLLLVALTAVWMLLVSEPASAVQTCAAAMGGTPNPISVTSIIALNGTSGVYPPQPLLGTVYLPSVTFNCTMGKTGDMVSIGEGKLSTTSNTNWFKGIDGWWRAAGNAVRIGPDGDTYGDDETTYTCAIRTGAYNSGYCYLVRMQFLGPLVCVGLDGVHSAPLSSDLTTVNGGGTATVPCRDRSDGSGVTITLPPVSMAIASTSKHGYVGGDYKSHTSIVATGATNFATVPLGFISLGAAAYNMRPGGGTCHSGSDQAGPCLTYMWSAVGPAINFSFPNYDSGVCVASLNGGSFDWGTISGLTMLSPGQPLPGVTAIRKTISIACSGGDSVHAGRLSLVAHGESNWHPDVFDSDNDTIGYQLRVGSNRLLLTNEKQQVLGYGDGVSFTQGAGGNGAVVDIEGIPVSKSSTLAPGLAKTTISIDVYALSY